MGTCPFCGRGDCPGRSADQAGPDRRQVRHQAGNPPRVAGFRQPQLEGQSRCLHGAGFFLPSFAHVLPFVNR